MSGGYRPAQCDGMRVIAKCCRNIDHYRPDQRHYHDGAAVHNGRSYPECGQIVPALTAPLLATRHYQADITSTLPLVSLKQLPHLAD